MFMEGQGCQSSSQEEVSHIENILNASSYIYL
jgi:hypothetical protein